MPVGQAKRQLEIPERTWLEVGDRVVELPGTPSQCCGTVVDFAPMLTCDGLFPIVLFDDGRRAFSSYEWGLRRLQPVEQLSLFEVSLVPAD